MTLPLIKIENLTKQMKIKKISFPLIHPLNLDIYPGETVGLIGESGSGKSTLGKLILKLTPSTTGSIYFNDQDILTLGHQSLKSVRKHIQMVFQDPFSSLNPRMTVEEILSEPFEIHFPTISQSERKTLIDKIMKDVGLNTSLYARFPHELSGGQNQRIGIARALAVNPKFLVLDEAISALDVTTQHQILDFLINLKTKQNLAFLFISHHMNAIQKIANRIAVMYLGRIVEISPKFTFFQNPLHPYSQTLLYATPSPDPKIEKNKIYQSIQGELPSIINQPTGCPFHPRCSKATPLCRRITPSLQEVYTDQFVACHYPTF